MKFWNQTEKEAKKKIKNKSPKKKKITEKL